MKLRNKKTGEIASLEGELLFDEKMMLLKQYNSLAELNEEWEDYEEPKEYWYIDPMVCGVYCTKIKKDEDLYDFNKQIGNYFETKEEAKKAVEKLKAWKSLKNKGFRFDGYGRYHWTGEEWPHIAFSYPNFDDLFDDSETVADLDLLFGGEE